MTVSQDQFVSAMLDPGAAVPDGLISPGGGTAGRRFNVYRNNVAVSLTEALMTAFPVVTKLLGQENFKGLAGIFLRQHPPDTPLMMYYGSEMPDFIAGLPQLQHLPYLPDVARLELAMRESYHAADAPVLPPEALAIDPSTLMGATMTLHPAVRVIASDWPIHAIWAFNMIEGSPKPEARAETVLVTRPEFDPVQTIVSTGGGAFLAALGNGETFGVALDTAQMADPGFDLSTTLATLLAAGAFTEIGT